jgi:hypothetical protein
MAKPETIPITTIPAALAFWLLTIPAKATDLYAAPGATDNLQCTQTQPCTPRGAVELCISENLPKCKVHLAAGVYLDPAIDIRYYRYVEMRGPVGPNNECTNPAAATLRATQPGTALIIVQDHAIGEIACLTLDAVASGNVGIQTRQHVVVDYANLVFGYMPGGTHIGLNEYAIANCVGFVLLPGGAVVHVSLGSHSKLNLNCALNTFGNNPYIEYLITARSFSIVDAHGATFSGNPIAASIGCQQDKSDVFKGQSFPALNQGNC